MRKKLTEFKKDFESQCKKHINECKLDYIGSSADLMKSFPQSYRMAIKQIEDKILHKN